MYMYPATTAPAPPPAAATSIPTRRKPIPRPWLHKRQQSHEARSASLNVLREEERVLRHDAEEFGHAPNHGPFVFANDDDRLNDAHSYPPPVLLEKRNTNIFKSMFNLECCFRGDTSRQARTTSTTTAARKLEEHEAPRTVIYHHHTTTTTTRTTTANNNSHTNHFPLQPPVLDRDNSFPMAPTPTVIYVIHGNPAMLPPSQEDIHQWHQSFILSSQQRPPAVAPRDRLTSYDTGMTSLSCEDSLAFSNADHRGGSRTTPASPSAAKRKKTKAHANATNSATAPPSIPRPPQIRKTQSTASGLPPMVPISRPPTINRASTTGSTASSRHRRSPRLSDVVDTMTILSIGSSHGASSHEDDDDTYNHATRTSPRHGGVAAAAADSDDDSSTIASSEGDSPIFPMLASSSSLPGGVILRPYHHDDTLTDAVPIEVYLPKCNALEQPNLHHNSSNSAIGNTGEPLISGWVAYSMGDSLLHKRTLNRTHLAYLVITEEAYGEIRFLQPHVISGHGHNGDDDDPHNTSGSSGEHSPSGQGSGEDEQVAVHGGRGNKNNVVVGGDSKILKLPLGTKLSVQTIESQGGRSVVIRNDSNRKILCTLMPVNLPPQQFCPETGRWLTKNRNHHHGNLHHMTFVGTQNNGAAQHDAALHLWFGLDGWVRRGQQQAGQHL